MFSFVIVPLPFARNGARGLSEVSAPKTLSACVRVYIYVCVIFIYNVSGCSLSNNLCEETRTKEKHSMRSLAWFPGLSDSVVHARRRVFAPFVFVGFAFESLITQFYFKEDEWYFSAGCAPVRAKCQPRINFGTQDS